MKSSSERTFHQNAFLNSPTATAIGNFYAQDSGVETTTRCNVELWALHSDYPGDVELATAVEKKVGRTTFRAPTVSNIKVG